MKKKVLISMIFIIAMIIVGILMYFLNTKNIQYIGYNKSNKDKSEEEIDNIEFNVYSNENNQYKVSVEFKDEEKGIKQINYRDDEGIRQIDCNGKKVVAIDYTIKNCGEYQFSLINQDNETVEKTLVVNEEFESNLIDINIEAEKELGTEVKINIDYKAKGIPSYKIGNNGTWENYTNEFNVTSYEVLKKSAQNEDNTTVTVFAKIEDIAKNKIIVTKNIVNLDFDMPQKPKIKIISSPQYAILTDTGVTMKSSIEIQYDARDDIKNYYSTDLGKTWNEYTDTLMDIQARYILAKSVKTISGLEISTEKKDGEINPAAADAIGVKAYDGDMSTYYETFGTCYILVDPSCVGKKISFTNARGYWDHQYFGGIYLLDKDGKNLYSESASFYTHIIKVVENTYKLRYTPYNAFGHIEKIKEIEIVN